MNEHNGFFCGLPEFLEYVTDTHDFFDNCSPQTFSLSMIGDFIEFFGHPITERVHAYWCLPGKGIQDEMYCIDSEAVVKQMCAAAMEHKMISIIVDHNSFIKTLRQRFILPPPSEMKKPNNDGASTSVGTSPGAIRRFEVRIGSVAKR